MKTLAITLFSILLPVMGFAEVEVFKKTSTWTGGDSGLFSDKEVSGVKMNAIDNAMDVCLEENGRCVVKSVHLLKDTTFTNDEGELRRRVQAEAIVHGIEDYYCDRAIQRDSETLAFFDQWQAGKKIANLDLKGVRYGALMGAMARCHKAGFDFCTYVRVRLTDSNTWKSDSERYFSQAKATVRGYKIRIRRRQQRPQDD